MPRNTEDKTFLEQWQGGEIQKFHDGQVVECGNNIGIILYATAEYKTYQVKTHSGYPNKWDGIEGNVHEDSLRASKKKNPFDIPSWERYPGPASNQIRKLKSKFSENAKNRNTDIESELAAIEEHKKLVRSLKVDDAKEEVKMSEDGAISDDTFSFTEDRENTNNAEEIYTKLKKEFGDG